MNSNPRNKTLTYNKFFIGLIFLLALLITSSLNQAGATSEMQLFESSTLPISPISPIYLPIVVCHAP